MANKYIIHGATYCGNGTASNEAVSAGAAGAWNDLFSVLEGGTPAYGAIVAGDVIYMRSKTSAGVNLAKTLSANVSFGNSSVAARATPVTWILDAGTIWSGISGTLTYTCPSSYKVDFINYNRFYADVQDAWSIVENSTSAYAKHYFVYTDVWTKNIFFDFSLPTGAGATTLISENIGYQYHENLHVKQSYRYVSTFRNFTSGLITFTNLDVELTTGLDTSPVFNFAGPCVAEFHGGQIRGTGATSGVPVFKAESYPVSVRSFGFVFPKTMTTATSSFITDTTAVSQIEMIGADTSLGAVMKYKWGEADSRVDNHYPTLNATFPDTANTPWSWKLYPKTTTSYQSMYMPISKVFTEPAATKTVTMEVLIADSFTGVSTATLWLDVDYIDDSTGQPKHVSTRVQTGAALSVSTATWTAVTYGSVKLLKRKLSIATPTSIKQNTMVLCALRGTVVSGSANDLIFMCPDVVLT